MHITDITKLYHLDPKKNSEQCPAPFRVHLGDATSHNSKKYALSEYKHSLIFHVQRYVIIAPKPVPIVNPPNSAQLGDTPYQFLKLHPGPCSSEGMWLRTDTQTDRNTNMCVTNIHFA